MRMEQCSHQTLRPSWSTTAFTVFFIGYVPVHSAHVPASENVKLWPCCSQPDVRIPRGCRSTIVFLLPRAVMRHRCDRARTRSALYTCDNARRDTIGRQL